MCQAWRMLVHEAAFESQIMFCLRRFSIARAAPPREPVRLFGRYSRICDGRSIHGRLPQAGIIAAARYEPDYRRGPFGALGGYDGRHADPPPALDRPPETG